MNTDAVLQELISKICSVYQSIYGDDIMDIRLFGSRARGDYDADSDIDIVAIVRGDRARLQEQLKQVWDASWEIGLEYDAVISPMVIPYQEFLDYRNVLPFYQNVEKEGVRVA